MLGLKLIHVTKGVPAVLRKYDGRWYPVDLHKAVNTHDINSVISVTFYKTNEPALKKILSYNTIWNINEFASKNNSAWKGLSRLTTEVRLPL